MVTRHRVPAAGFSGSCRRRTKQTGSVAALTITPWRCLARAAPRPKVQQRLLYARSAPPRRGPAPFAGARPRQRRVRASGSLRRTPRRGGAALVRLSRPRHALLSHTTTKTTTTKTRLQESRPFFYRSRLAGAQSWLPCQLCSDRAGRGKEVRLAALGVDDYLLPGRPYLPPSEQKRPLVIAAANPQIP